jgi:hypothetical protein
MVVHLNTKQIEWLAALLTQQTHTTELHKRFSDDIRRALNEAVSTDQRERTLQWH